MPNSRAVFTVHGPAPQGPLNPPSPVIKRCYCCWSRSRSRSRSWCRLFLHFYAFCLHCRQTDWHNVCWQSCRGRRGEGSICWPKVCKSFHHARRSSIQRPGIIGLTKAKTLLCTVYTVLPAVPSLPLSLSLSRQVITDHAPGEQQLLD